MPHKLPVTSGADLITYLAKHGYNAKRQTSSHVFVQKEWRVFSAPLLRELKVRNVGGILMHAGIDIDEVKRAFP